MTSFDTSELRRNLTEALQRVHEAAADALETAVDKVLAESRPEVPTLTGTLARSGRTAVDRDSLKGAVGYGSGEAEDYARIVHENLSDHHPDGGPKFLERPLIRARAELGAKIAGQIAGSL